MPNDNGKWQWELFIDGREVIARGFAETETTAREQATEEARKAKLDFPWGTPIRIKDSPELKDDVTGLAPPRRESKTARGIVTRGKIWQRYGLTEDYRCRHETPRRAGANATPRARLRRDRAAGQ
jgi:hypothetical protein